MQTERKRPLVLKLGLSAGGLAIFFAILVLANFLVGSLHLRWDATSEKIHSLSDGTRTIMEDLAKPVELQLYLTRDVVNTTPGIQSFGRRVTDLLEEYRIAANGNITVTLIHPEPDSNAEDRARTYGLQGVATSGNNRFYMGLVALSEEREETIPFLDPARETRLEYDITRMITRAVAPKKRSIGILSGIEIFGNPQMAMQNPQMAKRWFFLSELEKNNRVSRITAAEKALPEDLDLLVLMNPREIPDPLLVAIDQFVLSGGNILLLADPVSLSGPSLPEGEDAALTTLLSSWGVRISKDAVVDFNAATRLMGRNNQVEENPAWLSLGPDALNADSLITQGLDSLLFPISGEISTTPPEGVSVEPLIRSSKNASLFGGFDARFGTDKIRKTFSPDDTEHALAVRMSGRFPSAFPDALPEGVALDTRLMEADKPATLVVLGDTDFLFDPYYMQQRNLFGFNMAQAFNDNLNLLLNITELLTGNPELVRIRTRAVTSRPFTKVKALEQQAQARWLSREQELERKAEETNRKLQALEGQKNRDQSFVLSAEQEAEIRRFQEERSRTNRELKQVRRNLRADIDRLGNRLKLINLIGMPLVVSLAGILFAARRRRKANRSGKEA